MKKSKFEIGDTVLYNGKERIILAKDKNSNNIFYINSISIDDYKLNTYPNAICGDKKYRRDKKVYCISAEWLKKSGVKKAKSYPKTAKFKLGSYVYLDGFDKQPPRKILAYTGKDDNRYLIEEVSSAFQLNTIIGHKPEFVVDGATGKETCYVIEEKRLQQAITPDSLKSSEIKPKEDKKAAIKPYPKTAKFKLGQKVWYRGKEETIVGSYDRAYLVTTKGGAYSVNHVKKHFGNIELLKDIANKTNFNLIAPSLFFIEKPKFSKGETVIYRGKKRKITDNPTNRNGKEYYYLNRIGNCYANPMVCGDRLEKQSITPDDDKKTTELLSEHDDTKINKSMPSTKFQLGDYVWVDSRYLPIGGYDEISQSYYILADEGEVISNINWNQKHLHTSFTQEQFYLKCIKLHESELQPNQTEKPQSDIEDAAYRVAATQLAKAVQSALVSATDSLKPEVSQLLKTDVGGGLIAAIIGYIVTYTPKFANNKHAERLAKEFRVEGMTQIGGEVLDSFASTVVPLLNKSLDNINKLNIIEEIKLPALSL